MPSFSKFKDKVLGKPKDKPPGKPPGSDGPPSSLMSSSATSTTSPTEQAKLPVSPAPTFAQRTAPRHVRSTPQGDKDIKVQDLWPLAYATLQQREKSLMEDFKEHLATHPAIQGHNTIASSDLLSNSNTVESIEQLLLDDRKNKQ